MDDAVLVLQLAGDADEPGAEHHRAESLEYLRPHDGVGNSGFVLEGHEDHAIGAAGTLAHQHETGDGDAAAGRGCGKPLVAENAAAVEFAAQERDRVRLERQMQMTVVLDHVLADEHGRQGDIGFERRRGRAGKQRQIILVAGAAQRPHCPQCLPTVEAEGAECIRGRQPFEHRGL